MRRITAKVRSNTRSLSRELVRDAVSGMTSGLPAAVPEGMPGGVRLIWPAKEGENHLPVREVRYRVDEAAGSLVRQPVIPPGVGKTVVARFLDPAAPGGGAAFVAGGATLEVHFHVALRGRRYHGAVIMPVAE